MKKYLVICICLFKVLQLNAQLLPENMKANLVYTCAVENEQEPHRIFLKKTQKENSYPQNALSWFKNRCFKLLEDSEYRGGEIPHFLIDMDKARSVNKKEYPKSTPISPGIYKEESYCLNLLPNRNYTLYFNKIKLESGSWSTKDGELLLQSQDGSMVFHLRITDQGLVSQLLPGDYKRVLLKKLKEKYTEADLS